MHRGSNAPTPNWQGVCGEGAARVRVARVSARHRPARSACQTRRGAGRKLASRTACACSDPTRRAAGSDHAPQHRRREVTASDRSRRGRRGVGVGQRGRYTDQMSHRGSSARTRSRQRACVSKPGIYAGHTEPNTEPTTTSGDGVQKREFSLARWPVRAISEHLTHDTPIPIARWSVRAISGHLTHDTPIPIARWSGAISRHGLPTTPSSL